MARPSYSGDDWPKIAKRFWAKVDKSGDCWIWLASTNEHGYGRFRIGGRNGKSHKAHRVAYYLEYGEWPLNGLHKCDNPPCVRPDHIFSGTLQDNINDMNTKGRYGGRFKSKLDKEQRLQILQRLLTGESANILAEEYGVHSATIRRCKNNMENHTS